MDKNNKILNNQYQQIDQNQSQQQEHSKKKSFMSLLAWFGAHKGITATIAATAFAGITLGSLGGAGVFTPNGVDAYTEVDKAKAENWFNSHWTHSMTECVDATFSFDFSNTSNSDWDYSKSSIVSYNGSRLASGINCDSSSWNWSDAASSKVSSNNINRFDRFGGANYNWDQIRSGFYNVGTTSNIKYYLNGDNSIFKFTGNWLNELPTSGTRTITVYISSNNCSVIKFVNVFESFTNSSSPAYRNLNGTVSFIITKNY